MLIYIKHLIITIVLSILGSYLAISLVLSFPLSSANSMLAMIIGVIAGLILYLPILLILSLSEKASLIWIITVDLIGFLFILYFIYGFAATVASV
jgi:hypothetical protein